jgi:uncharacterized protein YukE
MSSQQADVNDLQTLSSLMSDLTNYCDSLRQGAVGFAYMLPGEWKGPAFGAFIALFEQWSAGAEGLTNGASDLHQLAERSHQVYSATIEGLDVEWNKYKNSLG